MKPKLLIWLLAAVLLCGCSAPAPEATAPTDPSTPPAQSLPREGYYHSGSALESSTDGAVRVYPLDGLLCSSIAALEDGVLLFSSTGSGTLLTKLTGEDLYPAATAALAYALDPQDPSVLVNEEGVSFYNHQDRCLVILDENLREITSISVPEDMTGTAVLSEDRMTLYYSTGSSIHALDLDTRIPRVLRQHSADLTPQALLLEDSLLQCVQDDGSTVFISTGTGQFLEETAHNLRIVTSGNRYAASLALGEKQTLVFGTAEIPAQVLRDDNHTQLIPLGDSYGVLGIRTEETCTLDYFDLESGLRRSTLTLDSGVPVCTADGGSGIVWLLDSSGILYRWDTSALAAGDRAVYTDIYYTRSNPDLTGIAQCQMLALQIGQRHGVEILVWEDALAVAPWDYRVTEEYQVPVLMEQLKLLDQRLGNFPEGFLAQLSETCSGVTICLVRQLEGYDSLETLAEASGVQYWVEDHAYIALSTVSSTEGGLYHELCHIIDTRVFAESSAYDQWEEINPSGFKYDYDYAANATRNAGEYLRDAERCFIDTYSMSFPKEDRARVLEYAMTPGNEHYFQSETMQTKLMQICLGFREAFGLKKSPDTFLWEQYLQESLAYGK